jgi:short-subunit dehydrogenase involved in D-alanine esterification of teichoic acids
MRYKQLVSDKLEQLDNSFHQLNYLINTQDIYQAKEFMDGMREKIADIQTLINTNTED